MHGHRRGNLRVGRRGGLDWGGEDWIGAGFIAINPAQTSSVGRSMPRPYGSRGLTGAAPLREPRPYGMSGSGALQGRGRHAPRSGVLARFYFRCNKPRSNILCRPQHAAAVREPRPYGSHGRTGATAVREPRPYGMSGSGEHQGEVVMPRAAGYSPAFQRRRPRPLFLCMTTSPAFSNI